MHRERLVTHEAIGAVPVAPRGAVLPGGSGMVTTVSAGGWPLPPALLVQVPAAPTPASARRAPRPVPCDATLPCR